MIHQQYDEEMKFMLKAINDAYSITDNWRIEAKEDIGMKNPYDVVTALDKHIEKYLADRIKKQFPTDTILSEEFHNEENLQHRTWTIDPIDGTCNMVNSIPQFSIQMSFVVDEEIMCSAIKTCSGEIFYAQKDQGAYCNGERIYSRKRDLNKSIASFGDFPHSNMDNSNLTLKAVATLKDIVMKIRFFGAASLDYCYLAAGRTDLVFMYTKNKWDIYPGILLCEEAGCIVSGMDGKPYSSASPGVVASNNKELLYLVTSS